jgi:CelD/BcsL family acetyltransferase involved in cellulose biosynthesis
MTTVEVIDDITEIRSLSSEWNALAAENRLPLMSADHAEAWWRHLAPPGAQPRIMAVSDAGKLIGLAPFYVLDARRHAPVEYRLPGAELGARISPLAACGRERDVAAAMALRFTTMLPRADLIALDCLPMRSAWPEKLQASWPGADRPLLRQRRIEDVPVVSLTEPSYDEWLAGKSANFRSQMRRLHRRFLAAGGAARASTPDTLHADIATFMRLHTLRWANRGGSNLDAIANLPAMLEDLGTSQLQDGRFRMCLLEIDGEPISAQLFNAIGDHVTYLNGGWDERFAQHKPPMLSILYAIEDAFAREDRRLDLGPGAQAYKLRFADSNDPVSLRMLIAGGRRLPATWVRLAPRLAGSSLRDLAKRTLSPQQIRRGRSLLHRLRMR